MRERGQQQCCQQSQSAYPFLHHHPILSMVRAAMIHLAQQTREKADRTLDPALLGRSLLHFHAQVPAVPDAFGTHVAPAALGATQVFPHDTMGH
jgi:hypothetical protein